ncbi:tRNA pseudouridine(55) synthase TruB [Clostridium baratii]|uniref:tRNA pseudouridine synthase B n=1 Tax=Clostridium baratii str. Sullivan TaxID=1415775 RepID=A0A0A7FUG0_9CLOT|nr:tRNA pseudouridine(55) synthase TruB [Clostridium baratii]AIY82476.1 tRNA pseudouridine(55) synthase [Clostridium baratii str. Sullivan]MDU4910385.1 tRNA pseudouridine(55) synthase TruB [Clostridium baratii]CUP00579.1 tRNA pseudouridine synthase B [Clostridium baratii]
MQGVINVFKNPNMTSFDVVRIIKKLAKEKKVGHTGTLDPEAFGVLPICLGKATKIIDYIMIAPKTYKVKFELGFKTTTYDLEGEVLDRKDVSGLTEEDVLEVINSFKGTYSQIPPMYSALKKNGVRLYDLARQGIEVEREGREITIYDIEDIVINIPEVCMTVTCSKGTYIRSLCYDIGEKLNVYGTMVNLRRTATSVFKEEDSVNIDELTEDNIEEYLIPIDKALDAYKKITINNKFRNLLINGAKVYDKRLLKEDVELDTLYRVYDEDNIFIGLGKKDKGGFKLEKLLI